jgi:hypothetical protein
LEVEAAVKAELVVLLGDVEAEAEAIQVAV